MRIGLVIEYDGTEFQGSQLQAKGRTVQGELEKAIESLLRTPVRIRLASRTDAGVHARGQVAAFDSDTRLGMKTIQDALNHYLPEDVSVRHAAPVSDAFDPRRHASSREYVYTYNDGPAQAAIDRRTEVHSGRPMDDVRMDAAAKLLIGTHDFMAFAGGAVPSGASTVRRMDHASVERKGDNVRITFRANAFLNQQVRRMAGELARIGSSPAAQKRFSDFLERPVKGSAKAVAPPHGLCLTRIEYRGASPSGLPSAV